MQDALLDCSHSALEGVDLNDSFGDETDESQPLRNENTHVVESRAVVVKHKRRDSSQSVATAQGNMEDKIYSESFEFSDSTSSRHDTRSQDNRAMEVKDAENRLEGGERDDDDDDSFMFSDSDDPILNQAAPISRGGDAIASQADYIAALSRGQSFSSSGSVPSSLARDERVAQRMVQPRYSPDSFEFSDGDEYEIIAAAMYQTQEKAQSQTQSQVQIQSQAQAQTPAQLRGIKRPASPLEKSVHSAVNTQRPPIPQSSSAAKASQNKENAYKHTMTSSPTKSSPNCSIINAFSPPPLPPFNDFKVPRQNARNYSTIPQLERPNRRPVNSTLLLATQKPTIENIDSQVGNEAKKVQPIILSKEQEIVLQRVMSGISLFYTGSAGTGKSVLLRSIIKSLRLKHSSGIAVTASTGLAACNVGGITLHSFGGIGLGTGTVDSLIKKIRRNKKASKRWLETKVLIIDEVSMVDGELLDKLNAIAKKLRRNQAPFGGIQVVACGDFYQLPPVVRKLDDDGNVRDDVEAFFSFECLAWKETIQQTIILKEIFRQKGDQMFIDMLNEMRDGRISEATVNEFRRLKRDLDCPKGIVPAELFATRYEVDKANKARLAALPGDVTKFKAIDTGSLPEPQKSTLLANFLAPMELHLKKEAQVMCIKNFDETLVNGSLGTIVDFMDKDTYMKAFAPGESMEENGLMKDFAFNDSEHSTSGSTSTSTSSGGVGGTGGAVTTGSLTQMNLTEEEKRRKERKLDMHDELLNDFKNKKCPLVKFLAPDGVNTRTVLVEPEEWTVEDEDGNVLVSRVQFPLMLAWSLSIHKSQGQTLSKVKVDLRKVFETGQSYVALSRATSRDGLQVLNFNERQVRSHPKVVQFYKSLEQVQKNTEQRKFRETGQQKLNFASV
ncbi:uncharacterized protein LODBEIA_P18720 [Lodderomyces beijingensis]|uniref:ATP-dependent DNA helicase PIF1 n=1 Tax=Lodderomyces beijingensis TaxID=1775926 RepID=A0ABP0ZHK7_9ASCO